MTEKIFTGPLDRQLRDAMSYIKNYIIKENITKIPGRPEAERVYNFPYAAVEEAVSNAVYHRSYQIGEPITVTVTPEKMEIVSLPGPDRTITDEDIKNRRLISRRYRNRRIGDFLKELKLIEGRNTGIPTMLRAMEANGSKPPVFETDEGRSYFAVILPVHKRFLDAPDPQKKQRIRRSQAEIKSMILANLEQRGNLSSSELAAAMGYAKMTASVSKAISELMEEGRVVYLEPEKVRSRNQKICLRKQGGQR